MRVIGNRSVQATLRQSATANIRDGSSATGRLTPLQAELTGGADYLGDREPEYGNNRGITYFADELLSERSQHLRSRVSRSHGTGSSAGTSSRLARSLIQAINISCLLPTSA